MDNAACYIFGASPAHITDCTPTPKNGDFIIAADGGLALAERLGLRPDLICGDFDSLNAPLPNECEILTLPREKDDTDTLRAVKEGYNRGYRRFYLYGCFGGRFDHTLANLQTLLWLSRNGAQGFLYAEHETITVITNSEINFTARAAGTFSVFSVSGIAYEVTITGAKYELCAATLRDDFPLGVSNEFTGNPVSISVSSGSLVIVYPTAQANSLNPLFAGN